MVDTRCLPWTRSALCGSKAQLMKYGLGKWQSISQICCFCFEFTAICMGSFSLWMEGKSWKSAPFLFGSWPVFDASAVVIHRRLRWWLDVLVSPTLLSEGPYVQVQDTCGKLHGEPCFIFSPSFHHDTDTCCLSFLFRELESPRISFSQAIQPKSKKRKLSWRKLRWLI